MDGDSSADTHVSIVFNLFSICVRFSTDIRKKSKVNGEQTQTVAAVFEKSPRRQTLGQQLHTSLIH